MRNFDECLARMKDLYTYGATSLNEDKNSIEHSCIGADNKAYGIIRECNKFYIKTAPADKVNVFEAYDYIGGFNNKKDFEYASYNAALKNFDLKMMSLNEAFGGNAQTQSIDPSKKEDVILEGTEEMRKEIARQRQIMENAEKIGDYDVYPEGYNDVKAFESNDEDKPYTEKAEAKLDKDMPETKDKPEDEGAPYGDDAKTEEYKTINENKDGVCPNCGEKECVCEDTGDWEETISHVMKEEDDIDGDEVAAEDPEDIEVVDDEEVVEEPAEDEPAEVEDELPAEDDEFEVSDEEGEEDDELANLEDEIEDIKARLAALEDDAVEEPVEDDTVDTEIPTEEPAVEEPVEADAADAEIPTEEPEVEAFDNEDELDECGKNICESKSAVMNRIVESVVSQFMNEDVLHDFGKHPGYRKKPFTTPATEEGDDKPFGTSIGDGKPYDQAVKVITDSIMDVLKKKI